jgi:hypothetical protein
MFPMHYSANDHEGARFHLGTSNSLVCPVNKPNSRGYRLNACPAIWDGASPIVVTTTSPIGVTTPSPIGATTTSPIGVATTSPIGVATTPFWRIITTIAAITAITTITYVKCELDHVHESTLPEPAYLLLPRRKGTEATLEDALPCRVPLDLQREQMKLITIQFRSDSEPQG